MPFSNANGAVLGRFLVGGLGKSAATPPPVAILNQVFAFEVFEGVEESTTILTNRPAELSLSGPDAAQFTLVGGVVTLTPQNFEEPADADADNVYQVTVTAEAPDGTTDSKDFTWTVENSFEQPILGAPTLSSYGPYASDAADGSSLATIGNLQDADLELTDNVSGAFALNAQGTELLKGIGDWTPGSHTIGWRKTLADSPNSPLDGTWDVAIASEAQIAEIGVGPNWDTTGGSGYDTIPDPAAMEAARLLEGAKPAPSVKILFAHSQVILDDIWLPVQVTLTDSKAGSATLGKPLPCSLKVMAEGNEVIIPKPTMRTGIDERGRPWSVRAHWVKVKKPTHLPLTPVPGGAGPQINLYFEGISSDTTNYTSRVVGPFPFFPRDEDGVVIQKLHKTVTGTDFSANLVDIYNLAVTEFEGTGRAVIGEIVDNNKAWAVGRRGSVYDAIPWLTQIRPGLDHVTAEKCDYTLGDAAAYPSQGYSAPSLNKLWFHGHKHDVALTGGIQARQQSGANAAHFVTTDHDTYFSSAPASATVGVPTPVEYPEYGSGSGAAGLIRGRLASGQAMRIGAGFPWYFVSINGKFHDLPGFGCYSLHVDCNNDIDNVSGSAIENQQGGRYGGRVSRFGGFYSGLLTRPGDINPGLRINYAGSAGFKGVRRTGNVGQNGEFSLWAGTDRAAAEAAGPIKTFVTEAYKSMQALVDEVNADADIIAAGFTLENLITDGPRLDCTHLWAPDMAQSNPVAQIRDDNDDDVLEYYPYEITGSSLDLAVHVDIHANAIAYSTGTNIVGASWVDVQFDEYCGASPIALVTTTNNVRFVDCYLTGCTWWDDRGFTNRLGDWTEVSNQPGRIIGRMDGVGLSYCVFANGTGFFTVTTDTRTVKDVVIGHSYVWLWDLKEGIQATGIVHTKNNLPAAATNSKALMTEPSTTPHDDTLTFNDPANGDFTLKDPSIALLPDGTNYGGVFDADDVNQYYKLYLDEIGPPPIVTASPAIVGDPTEGSVLTASPGAWDHVEETSGQWLADGVPIEGATGLTYSLTVADVGKTFSYRELAVGPTGQLKTSTSNSIGPVLNGLLARVAMRADTTLTAERWTYATAADNGGADVSRGGYVFRSGNGAYSTSTTSSSIPEYLRGQHNMSGSGAYFAVKVPENTPLKMRIAIAASPTGAGSNVSFRIDDGAGTPVVYQQMEGLSHAAGEIIQYDGSVIALNDWLGAGAWMEFTSTTGWIYVRKSSVSGICSLRAIEVAYPSYGQVTQGPGPFYVANDGTGDDVTGDGSEASPWASIPGDPEAGGVVASFSVLSGDILLKDTGIPYRVGGGLVNGDAFGTLAAAVEPGDTSFTCAGMGQQVGRYVYLCDASGNPTEVVYVVSSSGAGVAVTQTVSTLAGMNKVTGGPIKLAHPAGSKVRAFREDHLTFTRSGPSGDPIRITSYGAGRAVLDGSVPVEGWSAVASGDVYDNPNWAEIETASLEYPVQDYGQVMLDNGRVMYPAQFPKPSDIGNFNTPYSGSDAFVELTYEEIGSAVSEGAPDSGGTGFREVTFVSSLLSRYPVGSLVGSVFVGRTVGNRLGEWKILTHPSSSTITFNISNEIVIHKPDDPADANFVWCVRGHPFDILAPGQYAYVDDGSTAIAWFAGTNNRSIVRMEYCSSFGFDNIEIDGVDLVGYGVAYGGAFRDKGRRAGVSLKNSEWRGISNISGNGAFRPSSGVTPPFSSFNLVNINVEETPRIGAFQMASTGSVLDKTRHRDSGRTSDYLGGPSSGNISRNFDYSDNASIHGNGGSRYQESNHNLMEQGYIMNHVLSYTAQGGTEGVSKANTVRNCVFSARQSWPGTTNEEQGTPGPVIDTSYVMQVVDGETDSVFEGVVAVLGNALMSGSSIAGLPSTGQIVRNCVFSNVAAVQLHGRIWQNVLILNDTGSPTVSGLLSQLDASSYGIEIESVATPWDGTITQKMQQVLTKVGDADEYESRTLGPVGAEFVKEWYVPAWGEAHALSDCDLTTKQFRAGVRDRMGVSSVVATAPGCAISLPDGQGDNSMFGMTKGVIYFQDPPARGTYSIVIRQTSDHPDLTGESSHDTTISIQVI